MRISGVVLIMIFFTGLALVAIIQPASTVSFHGGNLTCSFAMVQFRNGTCEPADVYVYKNATVVWMNPGPGEHAICVANDVSPPILPGKSYTKNFHEFGEYEYYCRYHPAERGRVIVR